MFAEYACRNIETLEMPFSLMSCYLSIVIILINLAVIPVNLNDFLIILFYSILFLDIKNFSILEVDHLYAVKYVV